MTSQAQRQAIPAPETRPETRDWLHDRNFGPTKLNKEYGEKQITNQRAANEYTHEAQMKQMSRGPIALD